MVDSNKLNLYVSGELVAQDVPLQYALIFAKAILDEYYADLSMTVIISRMCEKEVTLGAWFLESVDPYKVLTCSKCGYSRETETVPNFCEHCGAKMNYTEDDIFPGDVK